MLRIVTSPSVSAAKSYYTVGLSKGDYYAEGQESRGLWGGKAAELLGLDGEVRKQDFDALCDNRVPGGSKDEKLTVRDKANRRVGYDLNFHAPKSLSVTYALTEDKRLLDAFRESVRETMQQIEADVHTRVRAGSAMTDRRTGNLVWAEFTHFTARPVDGYPDPHLHAHYFVFNATVDPVEQRWKATQLGPVKRDAYFYEAAFHNRLAGRMRDLGYDIAAKGKFWEIAGFDDTVLSRFSRRGKEVDALAKKLGIEHDAKRKDGLAARTRESKRNDLSMEALRGLWGSALSREEHRRLIRPSHEHSVQPRTHRTDTLDDVARSSVGFAVEHHLERRSTIPERRLLDTALRQSLGRTSYEKVHGHLRAAPLLVSDKDGGRIYSRQDVLEEERNMIRFARGGRGTCSPLNKGAVERLSGTKLSPSQCNAASAVLTSTDRVMLLRGAAGTGKTRLMQTVVREIERGGYDVVVLAPTAEASRNVLRSEGFSRADTLAKFFQDDALQNQARGQVIWVDEAGLIGSKTMGRLFERADELGARVILGGDQRQHKSVERGDAFRLLIDKAGLGKSELSEILRQKSQAYREVAADLSAGRVTQAWHGIERMGAVAELAPADAYARAAEDYLICRRRGKSCLVISPTHAERRDVSQVIRERLQKARLISGKSHAVEQLVSADWTEAERTDIKRYKPGMVVQFHQHVGKFRSGQRAEVVSAASDKLVVRDRAGVLRDTKLPLNRARDFSVYETRSLELAAGDQVRVTMNGKTVDKKHALHNGSLYEIRKIGKNGDIELTNGMVIDRRFGHIDHGYVLTSYASQGKTVDRVVIVQTSRSYGATSAEQLYVSATRGRESLRIYTDDKEALRELALRGNERQSAVELFEDKLKPDEHQVYLMTKIHDLERKIQRGHDRLNHER